jgi:hypothetical protein
MTPLGVEAKARAQDLAQKLLSALYLFGLGASVPTVVRERLMMGRCLGQPGLAFAIVIGMASAAGVSAQTWEDPPIRGKALRLGAPGRFDWNTAQRVERRLRAQGVIPRSGAAPVALHAPMPVPVMPMPARLGGSAAAPLPDVIAAPSVSFDEPMAPSTTVGFRALGDNNAAIPPDTHGAVGPTELMTTLNTQVRRQDRNGNPVGSLLSLYGFWLTAGVSPSAPPNGPFDPRVHFDPEAGRWVTVACQAAANQNSALLVAVSTGSTPSAWYAWKIPADPANLPASGVWFDYPNVGFNRKWIVVQVNVFTYTVPPTSNNFVESRIYVFDKSLLYQGLPSTPTVIIPAPLTYGATQVPAQTYDFLADELYLMQRWNPNVSGTGYLRLYQLSGDVGAEALTPLGFPAAPAWSESAAGMADFAPQGPSCGANKIQTNDSRIQNVVQRNGRLWATHTVFYPAGGTPTRASVQWWQVATDATVLQTGLVDEPGNTRFYAFPSIAVNKDEDALLGFSSFSASEAASAGYTFRLAGDPPGTMQAPRVLKAGEACYYKAPTGRNRWGDFSATQVDPLDDTNMWTIQEYAASTDVNNAPATNVWSTWWGMVEPPAISIADASVAEGNSGTTLLTFNLGLSVPTSETVTVQWATANGTATDVDNDYVPAGGTVTFPPLATSATIQVQVNGDVKSEANETFFVDLSSPQYAKLADAQAAGTILNDDVPQISIGDVTLVEGTGAFGTETSFVFPVTLSNPSDSSVTVSWATASGTAVAGAWGTGDFSGVGPTTLTFAPGVVSRAVTVQVHADTLVEPAPDEVFYVDLSSPTGATIVRSRGIGRIQDDDAPYPGVIGLSILADSQGSGGSQGRNRLQWVTPAAPVTATSARIEYNLGGACPGTVGSGTLLATPGVSVGPNGFPHTGLTLGQQYCYTVWLYYGGSDYSSGASLSARPFDSTPPVNKVRWKLSTGMSLMAAPTVGQDAVIVASNDMSVQALQRDPDSGTGGLWPGSWTPVLLGSVAQHRLPVVPLAAGSRAFVATQDGRIHAIDTANGNLIWSTQLPEGDARGAPAGIFTEFGGAYDYVLVGTSAGSNNRFYALNPDNGAVVDAFPGPADGAIGSVGAILGTAAVDYATNRVYFASRRGTALKSLWCLELGPSSDALRLRWSRDLGVDVDGSPVLRGGRVYVADNTPVAWSIPADTGTGGYSRALPGASAPGFLFPDRRNGDLYTATNGQVVGLTDTGSALNEKWSPISLDQPSIALFRPGTNELYVGARSYSGTASLVRIDTAAGSVGGSVALETTQETVGAPSLDIGHGVVHVGSELGVLYAVQLPF